MSLAMWLSLSLSLEMIFFAEPHILHTGTIKPGEASMSRAVPLRSNRSGACVVFPHRLAPAQWDEQYPFHVGRGRRRRCLAFPPL